MQDVFKDCTKIHLLMIRNHWIIILCILITQPFVSHSQVDIKEVATMIDQSFLESKIHVAKTYQNGVIGTLPSASIIGFDMARKFPGMLWEFPRNWRPITGSRETICGFVEKFTVYGEFRGDDHNFNIVPNPASEDLLSIANWIQDNDIYTYVHTEVVPASSFAEANIYFGEGPNGPETVLLNESICTYGPYVQEASHGFHPENSPI